MSSRQEEKEQRRKAREEAERLAKASSARTRRLQIVGGVVLGVAVIVVAVVLVLSGSGGGDSGNASTPSENVTSDVTLPTRKITDLTAAAKAGDCTVKTYPIEGREHVTGKVDYKTNPPTSGNHNINPAADGVYDPGNTPAPENFVHTLEHGRVEFQYKPGSPQKTIDTLTAIFNEPLEGTPGYHALVFENNTGMTAPVAAAAWGHLITCNDLSDGAIDALRAFRAAYTDKGPELIP
jgi:hypothetical protein